MNTKLTINPKTPRCASTVKLGQDEQAYEAFRNAAQTKAPKLIIAV